jgi:hypothetical protein
VQPDANQSQRGAKKFEEIACEQAGGLGEPVVEKSGERREKNEGNEEYGAEQRVLRVHLLLGDLTRKQLEGQRSEDRREEEVVAEGSEKLAGEQERVVAIWFHGEAGVDRRTAYLIGARGC